MLIAELFNYSSIGSYDYSVNLDDIFSQIDRGIFISCDPELIDLVKGLVTIRYNPEFFYFVSTKFTEDLASAPYVRVSKHG